MTTNQTGLYNYGYRDYSPINMRFTTVDPIKDSYNWYAYVGNDPINYIDPFGLESADAAYSRAQQDAITSQVKPSHFTQDQWSGDSYGDDFTVTACAATSLLNEVSEQYTAQTRESLTYEQANAMMQNAVNEGTVDSEDAYTEWAPAANDMWDETGLQGDWSYNQNGDDHKIYATETGNINYPYHFINSAQDSETGYFDVNTGEYGDIRDKTLRSDWQYRNVDFSSDLDDEEGSDCE